MNYVLLFIAILTNAASQLSLKKGLEIVGESPHGIVEILHFVVKAFSNLYVISAVLLTVISFVVWLQVASRMEISYIYPFIALSYILVALFSIWMFHDHVSALRWVGIGVVCLGVFLVARS